MPSQATSERPSEPTEPTTPKKSEPKRPKFKHVSTPTRAAIRGTISFLEAQSIPYSKAEVFEHFEVPRATGYRILKDDSARTRHNNPLHSETRGRKATCREDESQQVCQMPVDGTGEEEGNGQWLAPESPCFEMGYEIDKNGTSEHVVAEDTEYRKV